MAEQIINMDGHILDSLLLPKVLDIILSGGAEYEIQEITIGRTRHDPSHATIRVIAKDNEQLRGIVLLAKEHGASE